jgi:hypothetical protein
MTRAIALIPVDLNRTPLGLPARVARALPAGGPCVLAHSVRRMAAVPNIAAVVLVHPADQDPVSLLGGQKFARPVVSFPVPPGMVDPYQAYRIAARKWALTSWRGGLGGMTCYDELLPAGPLAAALAEHKADAALLAGADWALVDPVLSGQVLDLHLAHPEALAVTFSQAPPGLAGIAVSAAVLKQLAENAGSSIGQAMAYNPQHPQADAIGRDVCFHISGEVRSCPVRLIYDTPRSCALIDALAAHLGPSLASADASAIARAVAQITPAAASSTGGDGELPQQVTLELTPQRITRGLLTPQNYLDLNRDPMPLAMALRIVRQLGSTGDVAITLGGLGDVLLYESWEQVVAAAHEAGVLGIAIETDLLAEPAVLERLLELPIDLVSVRLNADSPEAYQRAHGIDVYKRVLDNIGQLMNSRADRVRAWTPGASETGAHPARHGLPWIVPRFIKTVESLAEMETFFDRWVHFSGHAVIDPPCTGQGPQGALMPVAGPVPMAPPRRRACRQLHTRMTIHSDGRVARCDQDWLAEGSVGTVGDGPADLAEAWRSMQALRGADTAGRWDGMGICAACPEWHRP